MKTFILLLILSTTFAFAEDDHCSYFKYCGGAAPKKSVNTSTSASLNPANLARIKGLGLETLLQPNNPVGFSLVTGNGNIGGAIISPNLENSFFGNRTLESDNSYLVRNLDNKRYKTKKINIAAGFKVFDKKDFAMDAGVSLKRNPDVKKINPGAGFSMKLGVFSLGAYIYKDDVQIDMRDYTGYLDSNGNYYNFAFKSPVYSDYVYNNKNPIYQESFWVNTLSAGLKIKRLSLDWGMINSRYKFYNEANKILIYSVSYQFNNVMVNVAFRNETSPLQDFKNDSLVEQQKKNDIYGGIQYMISKNFMLGIGYNTFLLDEVSGTFTIFLN